MHILNWNRRINDHNKNIMQQKGVRDEAYDSLRYNQNQLHDLQARGMDLMRTYDQMKRQSQNLSAQEQQQMQHKLRQLQDQMRSIQQQEAQLQNQIRQQEEHLRVRRQQQHRDREARQYEMSKQVNYEKSIKQSPPPSQVDERYQIPNEWLQQISILRQRMNDPYLDPKDYVENKYKKYPMNFKGNYDKKQLPDGSIEEGQTLDGKLNGPGRIISSRGAQCAGEFVRGKLNGRGYYLSDKKKYLYYGNWRNDKPHGFGFESFQGQKKQYYGQFKNGVKHGKGTLLNSETGKQYTGEFENDNKHGTGTMVFYSSPDSPQIRYRYIGQFRDNKMEGRGKMMLYDESDIRATAAGVKAVEMSLEGESIVFIREGQFKDNKLVECTKVSHYIL